uniref:Uncharacterized protein n=1 Tax=Cacopsylla melanoneura TaxID=428564 RepID=A0A8D8ZCZ0_9HEMI
MTKLTRVDFKTQTRARVAVILLPGKLLGSPCILLQIPLLSRNNVQKYSIRLVAFDSDKARFYVPVAGREGKVVCAIGIGRNNTYVITFAGKHELESCHDDATRRLGVNY